MAALSLREGLLEYSSKQKISLSDQCGPACDLIATEIFRKRQGTGLSKASGQNFGAALKHAFHSRSGDEIFPLVSCLRRTISRFTLKAMLPGLGPGRRLSSFITTISSAAI